MYRNKKRYSKNYINKSWQHTKHNGPFFFACVCRKSGGKKNFTKSKIKHEKTKETKKKSVLK